jgi:hypothetical protein
MVVDDLGPSMTGWAYWATLDRSAEYARRSYAIDPVRESGDLPRGRGNRSAGNRDLGTWRRLAVDLGVTP